MPLLVPRHRLLHSVKVAFLVAFLLALGASRADEAVLPDGRRLEGELHSDGQGRLLFQPPGQRPPLALGQLDQVRFPADRLPPARVAAPYRVLLRGRQHLTGELLGIGSDQVQFRTPWSGLLSIPRAAVTAVHHAPGFVTIFVDDFENDLKAWRFTGASAITTNQHASGQHSLCFHGPGEAEHKISQDLTAGRVGINFHAPAPAKSLSWQFEAEFAGSAEWRTVRLRLDPRAGNYVTEVSGAAVASSRPSRRDTWQRLNLEFGPDTLLLSIDEEVLWFCRKPGSGGSLRTVRLSCTPRPSQTKGVGEVCFDDFSVARAVPDLPHPKGDSDQDEVWLLSGDQWFGEIAEATGGRIQLRARFGSRSLNWGDVRGIYFRQSTLAARKPDSKAVRVWLRSGIGFEPDILDGIVRRFDRQHLVLSHEVLGELEIDRQRLHRIRLSASPFGG